MKKIYKCRVCGYVLEKMDPPDICPACGVKGKIFEEYDHPISKKRRIALELNIHPILVHFPVAFAFSLFLINLLLCLNIFKEPSALTAVQGVIIWVLPFVALLAALGGMYDGKLRFKRMKTPHLKKKMVLSLSFVFVSALLLVIQVFFSLDRATYNFIFLIFSLIISGLAVLLGFIGGRLIEAKVRG
ncbi:MAG: hypothetical protein JW755_09865 [Candidatus Aminicenantes bacterium]|nr:hypothetical protein [Candidatus Aminicenantes bacterium]